MRPIRSQTLQIVDFLKFVIFGGMLAIPGYSLGSDLTEHLSEKERAGAAQTEEHGGLSPGHRHIEGMVETVEEDLIKVETESAGGMTPRFLNLSKLKGDDVKPGDVVQIEVNAQNEVVRYHKLAPGGEQ